MEENRETKVVAYPTSTYGSTPETEKALASIATLLKESTNILPLLRREFRGEGIQSFSDGTWCYVQITKPMFIRLNPLTEKPLKETINLKDGIVKEVFIPNDEAIEEVLSMLKFMGLNQITLLTNIDENNILDDLKEFECKLAALLCLKQKAWGIDKELLPMIQCKIKTIVQDARYQACEGNTIKAIQKTVQRIEHSQEGLRQQQTKWRNPYS